jgi:hypothetical protein
LCNPASHGGIRRGSVACHRICGRLCPEVIGMEKETRAIIKHRVIAMLDRKELEFLDKMGKDALFSTGHKLSYNEIVKGLIDFAMEAGLTGEKINSISSLKQKLFQNLKGVDHEIYPSKAE